MRLKTFTRTFAGLGLTAGLFLGCQEFMGQKSSNDTTAANPSAALMRLAIKDSGACLDLKARCLAAHRNGSDSAVLDTTLVNNCILDTAAAHRIGEDGFEGGERRHGGHGGDFDAPGMDSAAAKAICDSMTAMLAKIDTTDSTYGWFKHETAEACREPMPFGPPVLDSAAAKAMCDSLTTVLAATDSTSTGYAAAKHAQHEACEEREEPGRRGHGGFEGHGDGRGHGRHERR